MNKSKECGNAFYIKKSECSPARVSGSGNAPGWFLSRLTIPVQGCTFFCPVSFPQIFGNLFRRAGKATAMVTTTAIEALLYHLPRTENPTEFALQVVDEYEARHDKLTKAQRETLHLVCCGFRNKDVARESGVSVRTVEQRRRRICNVFRVSNAVEVGVIVGAVAAFRSLLANELKEREEEQADVLPLDGLWEGGVL